MTHEQQQQAQANFRKQKAALTRAKNTGDWRKVKAAAQAALESFDAMDVPWPDDWRRWGNAVRDADSNLARGVTTFDN